MTQEELLRLGFLDEAQYQAAKTALETNAPAYGAMGFHAGAWGPAPIAGTDYSHKIYSSSSQYPNSADLTSDMPPVYDQGGRGTCVANATTGLLEYYYNCQIRLSRQFFYWALKTEDGGEAELKKFIDNPSEYRDFIELVERMKERFKSDNQEVPEQYICNLAYEKIRESFSGAQLETAFKVMMKYGICREELMPYASEDLSRTEAQSPSEDPEVLQIIMQEPLNDAATRIIKSGLQLLPGNAIDSYKRILSGAGGKRPMPLVMAVQLFQSFHSEYTKQYGWVSCPLPDDRKSGAHAMLAVGYKDTDVVPGGGYLIVRNSWGTGWAWNYKDHHGYARIPYAYISHYAFPQVLTIIADNETSSSSETGWPPKKDKMAKYLKTAEKMMRNRKGLFNIGKGETVITDLETGKVDKDTPENRRIFIENGYSWEE